MSKYLTPWFPVHITPVHIGVYETEMEGVKWSKGFSFWNGKRWGDTQFLPGLALDTVGLQNKKWRGLKERSAHDTH
jgi:hypothetical protein